MLEGIQNNHTIQRKVKALEEFVSWVNELVHNLFRSYNVQYPQLCGSFLFHFGTHNSVD
jgi:hypothetical protein